MGNVYDISKIQARRDEQKIDRGDKFFESFKICSDCGKYHDRDANSAINMGNEDTRVVNALL